MAGGGGRAPARLPAVLLVALAGACAGTWPSWRGATGVVDDAAPLVRELVEEIAVPELRKRILEVYDTLEDAFAELDADPSNLDAAIDEAPISLKTFVASAKAWKSPLTEAQATYAFMGLDRDGDGFLQKAEFVDAFQSGDFYSTLTVTTSATTTSRTKTQTATTTQPQTSTTSSTTTTPRGIVAIESYKSRLMEKYSSTEDAFRTIGENPVDVGTFSTWASKLDPPLTPGEARYAFAGLDVDGDQLLLATEHLAVLTLGHFFPEKGELVAVRHATTPSTEPPWTALVGRTSRFALPALLCLVVVGYLARTILLGLRLPGALGPILTGAALECLVPGGLGGGALLQELLFVVALLSAGADLNFPDLTKRIVMSAVIPALAECLLLACCGGLALGLAAPDALALGVALFSASDGIVVPAMQAMRRDSEGHRLPRLTRLAAPVESNLALLLCGLLLCFSPALHAAASWQAFRVGALSAMASCGVGAFLGAASGWLLPARSRLSFIGRQCFTGAPAEGLVLLLCAVFAAYGLGAPDIGVPIGLRPELTVLSFAAAFGAASSPQELRDVQEALGGVWLFAQVLLLGFLGGSVVSSARSAGAAAAPGAFVVAQFGRCLTLALAGVGGRLVGAVAVNCLGAQEGSCVCGQCAQARAATGGPDALFAVLAALPRSTTQAAIASAPVLGRLLLLRPQDPAAPDEEREAHVTAATILIATAFYTTVFSAVGTVLLQVFGPRLLRYRGAGTRRCDASMRAEAELSMWGWTRPQRAAEAEDPATALGIAATLRLGLISEDDVLFQDADAPAFPAREAVQTLARLYNVDPAAFASTLQRTVAKSAGAAEAPPSSYARLGVMDGGEDAAEEVGGVPRPLLTGSGATPPGRGVIRRLARRAALPSTAHFEADGGVLERSAAAGKAHSQAVRL